MNTAQKVFLVLFIFSTVAMSILFTSTYSSSPTATETPSSTQNPNVEPTASITDPEVDPSHQGSSNIGLTALIGSVITSATSLIGFVTTTVITWRKEKREASMADIQRMHLETELEKSKLELEKLKKNKPTKKKK